MKHGGLLESVGGEHRHGAEAARQLARIESEKKVGKSEWLGHAPSWIKILIQKAETEPQRRREWEAIRVPMDRIEKRAKTAGEEFTGTDEEIMLAMIAWGLKEEIIGERKAKDLRHSLGPLQSSARH